MSDAAPELSGSRFTGLTDVLRRQLHSGRLVDYAFMALFVVLLVAAALSSDNFFTHSNLINLARQIVTNGLISLGMLFVILSGGIDLSVGAIVALGGIIAAGIVGDVPLALAVLVALAVGSLAGAVNGVLVARFRLPSFIVTLATLTRSRPRLRLLRHPGQPRSQLVSQHARRCVDRRRAGPCDHPGGVLRDRVALPEPHRAG